MTGNVPMETNYVVGVDVGGSHVTAGLVDIMAKTVDSRSLVRRVVDPHADAATIIANWSEAIREVAKVFKGKPYRVGMAMPGPFDYDNGISLIKGFNKYEALYELNVKELLAQQLDIPVAAIKMKNDAAAFLLGEVFCGAAAKYSKAVGLTLGTGLGSARMTSDDAEACDVNVSPLHDGRAEDYISIRWFLQRYETLSGYRPAQVKYIAERVGKEDHATQVFEEFTVNLAVVLQRFIVEEQPDMVVLGGGIANSYELFYPALRKMVNSEVSIRQSLLGEAAAMAGAAGIWSNTVIPANPLEQQ